MKNTLQGVNRRNFTNNTQRAAYRLLNAGGTWVSRADIERTVTSAAARIRDLRKDEFGSFTVECAAASDLGKRGTGFFYRIPMSTVRRSQVKTVFRV